MTCLSRHHLPDFNHPLSLYHAAQNEMKDHRIPQLLNSIWNLRTGAQQPGGYLVPLSSLKHFCGVEFPIVFRILLTSGLPGFPLSFGVFQNYYSHLPQFANNPYIPIVGTVASGISYLGAPLVTPVIKRYSRYRRQMIWFGCKLIPTSME